MKALLAGAAIVALCGMGIYQDAAHSMKTESQIAPAELAQNDLVRD